MTLVLDCLGMGSSRLVTVWEKLHDACLAVLSLASFGREVSINQIDCMNTQGSKVHMIAASVERIPSINGNDVTYRKHCILISPTEDGCS